MRYALAITVFLALITFGYSMIGESGAYSRNSEIQSVLSHLEQGQQPLTSEMTQQLDIIFKSSITRWVVIRWLSIATLIAALISFYSASRKKI